MANDKIPAFFKLMLESSEEDREQATHLIAGLLNEMDMKHYPALFSVIMKTLAEFVWHDPTINHENELIGAAVVPLEDDEMYCAISFEFMDKDQLFAKTSDTVH